ncbi:MAG TPA: signal peptidase I [Ilumatobacteraceae bacterium]|nr:signal peptidase I [Ilumatobacteraceae bacterium]
MANDEIRVTAVDPDQADFSDEMSVDEEYDDVTDPDSPSHRENRKRKHSGLIEWIVVVVVAITSALLVRAYVLQQFAVEGTSMLTTLHPSDRVLVNKLSYRLHDPRRGDVVVLKRIESNAQERDLIKRVVALPGETVEYRDCQLFIDGSLMNEPYLDPQIVSANRCGADQPPVTVEPEHVFVMGDNRGGSLDSRDDSIGQVSYSNLIGRAFVVMWPFGDWQWL